MLNNSESYGSNEAPPNVVTSVNRPQSNASKINHNFNDFGKFLHQATPSASGYYEAHNFHNFGQPPVTIPPITHPLHAYQNMGHGSAYFSQNSHYSYDNAVQNYLPAVSATTQAEHYNNMLNFDLNFHTKARSPPQTTIEKEFDVTKDYPLNIPQVPTKIFQNSSNINSNNPNPQNLTENSITLSQNEPQISTSIPHNMTTTEDTDLNNRISASPCYEVPLENTPEELITKVDKNDKEISTNLNQKPTETKSEISPTIQRTTYNIVKNNNFTRHSIFEKTLSESKRKSLEKTVRLIESILVNSNTTKPEIVENTIDPLAFSPNPDIVNTTENKHIGMSSDDEALVKKLPPKNKRKSKKKSLSKKLNTSDSVIESPTEMKSKLLKVRIEDIKIEPMGWPDIEYRNPFVRDTNGVFRTDVGDEKIIDMETSVQEALTTITNGTTKAYFECPHCSLLLKHPKRFLIHTKWHTFGLLNEKRAEIMKEREDRAKEKREARSIQRLSVTLAAADESDPRFPCKDCDDIFPTKTSLKNHRRKCHPTEVTECRICLAPVRGLSELRAHMTCHEAAGLHQCPRCPKRFKYRHSLAKHADTHREKTHSCAECGKLFGSSALVRLHMKVHERAARGTSHRCAYCGKGFYEAYNLHVHERTHRNDKPFKCDICESCFVTNSSLKRHVKVSHSGAKPYPCQVCQKCFSSATIRDRHELRVHSDQEQFPHQCRLCPRRYMKPKDLRSHTYKMHPKKKKEITSDTENNSS